MPKDGGNTIMMAFVYYTQRLTVLVCKSNLNSNLNMTLSPLFMVHLTFF